jgi:hypothetical protein
MSVSLTVNQSWTDGKRLHVVGNLKFVAGNYTTGGINLSLLVDGVLTSQPIVHSDIVGKGGTYSTDIGTLYEYRYLGSPNSNVIGQQLANGLIRIYLDGTEISAGALPANVLNDTVDFYGIFQKY